MGERPAGFPGAVQLAARVRSGELSAEALVRERFELVARRADLNALVLPRSQAALAEARAIDQAARAGAPLGPLAGVPVSIKESLDVAGLPSTAGIESRRQMIAPRDCAAVAALRAAGAVVIGKSNLSQALIYTESDNPVYGRCQHPERAGRSPGGSSGGEGALLAIGASTLGLGSDIGGSGRIPAAFCGIASLMPTRGRLPDPQRLSVPLGQLAIPSQLVPMARRIADVETLLRVLNPAVHALPDSASVDLARLRVGVYTHDGLFAACPGARRVVQEAATALRAAGAQVQAFEIPDPAQAHALYYGLLAADGTRGLRRLLRGSRRDARVSQLLLLGARSQSLRAALAWIARVAGQRHLAALLGALGGRDVDAYWQLCERQADFTACFEAALDSAPGGPLDLLLGPPVATPAFTHGATRDLGVPGMYSMLYNLLGWPAGVVPAGRVQPGEESDRPAGRDLVERAAARVEAGSAGLPLGVQIAARPWREHEALAALACVERVSSGT